MARFTIFGASGFIGGTVARSLEASGHEVLCLGRADWPESAVSLGHGIFAIGLTANFRDNLTATARAHVSVLCDALDRYSYDSFLYLSSTRVYMGAESTSEDAPLVVPIDPVDRVYNLSKLTGESLCLARGASTFRVARIANVVGPGDAAVNFLPSLLDDVRRNGHVLIRSGRDSAKDYIDVGDVSRLLEEIALRGNHRLYNVASGVNVSNRQIAALLEARLGARVEFARGAPTLTYPVVNTTRIREEFGFDALPFETSLDKVLMAVSSPN